MALELRIDVQANSSSITFFETTCAYDAVTNDTGWGVPNPETTDATSATLYITQPNNNTPTDTINLFPEQFPSDSGLGYKILQSSLIDPNNTGKIQDGVWSFEYEVFVTEGEDSVEYDTTCKFLFTHNAECCIAKRVSQISPDNSNNSYDDETFYLRMILESAEAAFCNQEFDRAQKLMDELTRKCGCCCKD